MMDIISEVDQACLILGTDKVQLYLLAGAQLGHILEHAKALSAARAGAETAKSNLEYLVLMGRIFVSPNTDASADGEITWLI